MERDDLWEERLSPAICLGLCTAPFLFLLAAVFFSVKLGWASVAVVFLILFLISSATCRYRVKCGKDK